MTTPSNAEGNQTSNSVDLGASKVNALANTDLREAIEIIFASNEMSGAWPDAINDLIALFQAREQQLLTELLEHAREYEITDLEMLEHNGETPLVAVPVSVIERLQNKTNDGGSD